MKLAYFSGSTLPSRQANSVHVMKMCRSFASLDHEVTLYATGETDVFDYYGVEKNFNICTVKRPNIRGLIGILFAYRIVRAAKKESFDTIYSRNLYASFFSRKLNIPFIFEVHGMPNNALQLIAFKKIIKSKNLIKLVVISTALKKIILENIPEAQTVQIQVAHDAADLKPLPPSNSKRLTLAYVGSLYQGRGIDLILTIAAKLPQYDFHIIGGSDQEVSFWQKQKTSNIVFHGFIPHSQLDQLTAKSDILLAPYQEGTKTIGGIDSTQWMSPLKIFESMASGKALISSNLPVLKEVLEHNYNSILIPPNDTEAWVEAITQLEDENVRQRLADNALDDIKTKYTWFERAKLVLDNES